MDHWARILNETPGLAVYLKPIAAKWARGVALPKQMMLGAEPKEPGIRRALDRVFGGRVKYTNGKTKVHIPVELWNDELLSSLASHLDIKRAVKPAETDPKVTLQRLRLSFPKMAWAHEWLWRAPEIDRLLRQNPESEQLLRPLLETTSFLLGTSVPITLSKLGSQFFNNSKILRGGTPRKILGGLLSQALGNDDSPEYRDIALQQFNVIDNPATTLATLFGAVGLVHNGKEENWIAERFEAGEPVTLNSYNLEGIDAVRIDCDTVITSENAAPFHDLVNERPNAILLYTGGYPNAAVCRLLQLLAEAGATCRHWGDTDPDGFMIAALLDRYIETSLFRCGIEDIRCHKADLKPLDLIQLQRGRQLLKSQPRFKFREELTHAIECGYWLEQERWASQ